MRRCKFFLSMIVLTLLHTANAYAQKNSLDKGTVEIGGSAGLTSTSPGGEADRITMVSVRPDVHVFVAQRFAVGGTITFDHYSVGDLSQTTFGIGPSVAYYFATKNTSVFPYLAARSSFATVRTHVPTAHHTDGSRSGTVAAGILSMLSGGVGIRTELAYSVGRAESGSTSLTSHGVGVTVGIAAFVH